MATFDSNLDAAADSGGGGGTTAVTQTNAVFVSKAGSDGDTGLTKDDPKLTIGAAITVSGGLTPTLSNRVTIHIQDAGEYDEQVVLPNYVSLFGPSATVTGTELSVVEPGIQSRIVLHRIVCTGTTGVALGVGSTDGPCWIDVDEVTCASTINPAVSSTAIDTCYLKIRRIIQTGGGAGLSVASTSDIVLEIGEIEVATGTGFLVGGTSVTASGSIGKITDTGAGTGLDINAITGKVELVVGLIDCTTTYAVDTGNTLGLFIGDLVGSVGTISGTANVSEAGAGGGGGVDLAATLVLGNITGGTDIAVTAGDSIRGTTVVGVKATGTLTINTAPLSAPTTDRLALTSTSSGRTRFLKSVAGARTSGANDFDGSLGTVTGLAAEIVAAINDVSNAFDTLYFATDLGGGVIQLDAVTAGAEGNALALRKSLATSGNITLSPTTGFLVGGSNDTSPVAINHGVSGAFTATRAGSVAGAGRGVGAMDFQSYRAYADEVASGQGSVILSGRQNKTFVPNSIIAGQYNRMLPGDDYATSFMFGNRNYADFAPYGMMMGGSFNYIYSVPGATFERTGAQFGPTMMWGAGMLIYDSGQIQGAAGAYFGGYHRWEPGNFAQSNLIAGFRHEMKTGGSYVGANAIFGNQHDLYDAQASVISGEINRVINAVSASVIGEAIWFDSFKGGGAFGFRTTVTNPSVWGFGGGTLSGFGATQFSLVAMGASTSNATIRQMVLQSFDTTPDVNDVLVIRQQQAWAFEFSVSAFQEAGAAGTIGDSAMWTFSGIFKRDAANNTTLVGISSAGPTAPAFADLGAAAWTVEVDVDDTTNEALRVRVAGEASKTIAWSGFLRLTQAGAGVL